MAVSFIIFFSYSSGSILYPFNFVSCVFLLLFHVFVLFLLPSKEYLLAQLV
jgi:hypothetical protein